MLHISILIIHPLQIERQQEVVSKQKNAPLIYFITTDMNEMDGKYSIQYESNTIFLAL